MFTSVSCHPVAYISLSNIGSFFAGGAKIHSDENGEKKEKIIPTATRGREKANSDCNEKKTQSDCDEKKGKAHSDCHKKKGKAHSDCHK